MPVSFVADRLHWDPVRRVDGRVGRPAVTCGDRSPLVLVLEVGVQLVGDRRDTVSRVERFEQVLFADFARSGLIHYHALHRNHVLTFGACVVPGVTRRLIDLVRRSLAKLKAVRAASLA